MARRALLDDRSDLDSLALVCRPLRRPRLPTVWALDRKTVRGDARSVSVIIGGPPGLPWSACTPESPCRTSPARTSPVRQHPRCGFSLTRMLRGHNTARVFSFHHTCYQMRTCHRLPRIAQPPAATSNSYSPQASRSRNPPRPCRLPAAPRDPGAPEHPGPARGELDRILRAPRRCPPRRCDRTWRP